MDIELLTDFLGEARGLLEATDDKLMALERLPDDANLLNAVFRGYHTIKGSAGFLDLGGLVKLCHALETLFDLVRSGSIRMVPAIVDAALDASNTIRLCMDMLTLNPRAPFAPPQELLARLLALARSAPPPPALLADSPSAPAPPSVHYWISLHRALPPAPAHGALAASPSGDPAPLASAPDGAVSRSRDGPTPSVGPRPSDRDAHIKVDTHRLDAVLTLAGEVGLAKNRVGAAKAKILSKDFGDQALAELERSFNDLDRLTGSLQRAIMLTRMQPIGRLFSRYPRIVRDLSRSLGKTIEIDIRGQDTEIDKGMIEDLADPLVHLIRNSADHGIENPGARREAGKPAMGRIRLEARQEGDRILVRISDDGRGIDPGLIRAKARAKGMLDQAALDAMSDQRALEIIFMPGFSTAEALTPVSGRGVGMDVVRTHVSKMGGEVSIESTPGSGTAIELRLPLTLAVLPALILTAAGQPLAVPLGLVQEILSMADHPPQTAGGRPVINLRGEILSVLDLSALLGWGPSPCANVAALVDLGAGRRVALLAEGFLGRDEVMVKPLAGAKPRGVSGAVLDAQGDIVLILDLKELLESHFAPRQDKMA